MTIPIEQVKFSPEQLGLFLPREFFKQIAERADKADTIGVWVELLSDVPSAAHPLMTILITTTKRDDAKPFDRETFEKIRAVGY